MYEIIEVRINSQNTPSEIETETTSSDEPAKAKTAKKKLPIKEIMNIASTEKASKETVLRLVLKSNHQWIMRG